MVVELIDKACTMGARQSSACKVLGLSARTVQRWRDGDRVRHDGRGYTENRSAPRNKLSASERQQILTTANAAEFADLPPSQIVPMLSDQG